LYLLWGARSRESSRTRWLRKPVDKAVEWLVKKAKDLVVNLGKKLRLVKEDKEGKEKRKIIPNLRTRLILDLFLNL
jgi:hypothetical protein